MPATFSRVHTWVSEVLNYAALNAEFDNILNNLAPSGIGAYSTNAAQMKTQTDPGEVGTESLAPSLAGELERIRFVLAEIKGGDVDYWYESVSTSLSDLLNSAGGGIVNNRVSSGKVSADSNAPRYLIPAVTLNRLTLDATSPSFVYVIDGTQYTISADQVLNTLGLAPTTNNTAAVNDASLTSQESSKWIGEDGTSLIMDAAGTEITSLIGKYAGFKIVQGGNTEYFIAYVKSATELTNCYRGYFFDNLGAPIPRIAISDNAVITLMRLTWVYANTSGTLSLAYTNPTYAFTQPSAPATGDYWYDMDNMQWKQYNSVTWVAANATLIGVCIQDGTNCIGARAFDFAAQGDDFNNIALEYVSATQIRQSAYGGKVAVGTSTVRFENTLSIWDITQNLESGFSEAASTTYYVYVGEEGRLTLSPHRPYRNAGAFRGYYHPYELWRCVGLVENDASSNFHAGSILNEEISPRDRADLLENVSVSTAVSGSALTVTLLGKNGSPLSGANAGRVTFKSATASSTSYTTRTITSPKTVTVSSGSTLGTASGVEANLYVYLLDSGSDVVLGIANGVLDETIVQSATAEGGAGAADSANVLYATAAHSSKPIRLIAKIRITEATAGTWATNATEIALFPNAFVQHAVVWNGTHSTGTFTRTNTAYGEFAADASCSLTTSYSRNFPSVVTYESGGNALPGITFTPTRPGVYQVTAVFPVFGASAGHRSGVRLYDGTTAFAEASMTAPANGYFETVVLTAIMYLTTSAVNLRIQGKNDSGQITLGNADYNTRTIDWTVVRLGD